MTMCLIYEWSYCRKELRIMFESVCKAFPLAIFETLMINDFHGIRLEDACINWLAVVYL